MKLQHASMALLLLAGCSKMIPVDSDGVRDDINNRAKEKRAAVLLVDGTLLQWQRIELTPAALNIQGRFPETNRSIPLDSLQRLDFTYHVEGMGKGAVFGATSGTVLIVLANSKSKFFSTEAAALAGFLSGAIQG